MAGKIPKKKGHKKDLSLEAKINLVTALVNLIVAITTLIVVLSR